MNLHILNAEGMVVDTAESFPTATRYIDALDRRYPDTAPHTILSAQPTPPPTPPSLWRRLLTIGRTP